MGFHWAASCAKRDQCTMGINKPKAFLVEDDGK